MRITAALGPAALLLLLAGLASLIAAQSGLTWPRAALLGQVILGGEFGAFATLGQPSMPRQRLPEEEAARIQASRWWR
jgi:hypothetical protein